jgi:hypothetical protein
MGWDGFRLKYVIYLIYMYRVCVRTKLRLTNGNIYI